MMQDLISRQALCEYALNQKDKSVTPNDIMRFPSAQPEKRTQERTETHTCDLISRQAAMEEISKQQTYKMFEGEDTVYLDANDVGSVLASLPSAQPDISAYSDKLWKRAYERGKAEAQDEIVLCKDCKYYQTRQKSGFLPQCCWFDVLTKPNDFCSNGRKENR